MHGQGNYPTPVRQERPPAPQPQVYQSFHPYQHLGPTVGSAQSYFPHHRPPYPTSEQQPLQWSRNVHPHPFPGPSGYQLPTSQGHYAALMSDPSHSHLQPVVPVLPPPPLPPFPPPPPTSSPPVVPPIPQSSPPLETGSKRDGGGSLNGLLDRNNLMMEPPQLLKPTEDKSAYETQVLFQNSEKSGIEVGSIDAVVAQSPIDSDMDMEDDITHPDEEKKNCSSINANDEYVTKSEEDYAKEQLQPSHQAGGLILPVHENSLLVVASVSEAEKGGSKIASFHATMKVTSETNDSGVSENGQNEHPSDVGEEDSSARPNFRQPTVPVVSESGGGKLSDQSMEGASPFKLLQGYASDNSSESDEVNLLNNVTSRSANDVSTNFDAEKGCEFGSELRHETQADSNRPILSKSMVESPRNVLQTDKLSVLGNVVEGVSGRSHRGEGPTSIRDVSSQTKDSRNYDDNTGPGSANLHKADARSNSSKLNVDEFGRLVREGVSDSDTSDSPRYARRHARSTRKRSRSRSRSRSPHDRRRRKRSPLRRKERRSRSRSLSPKKRSRSRTPVMRRASEFGGDKLRREKGQIPECFDFLRGKCYRGATCRYSHQESNKNERSRYKRDKQHYQDGSRDLQSPDFHDREMKHRGSPLHMPVSMEAKNVKRPLDDSSADSLSKLGSLGSGSLPVADDIASNNSGYSAPVLILGKDKSLALESAVQYSNEIPQTVYQQGERTIDTVVSESTARAIPACTHYPDDIPDAKQGPTCNLSSVGAPTTKPYSTEEVPSQSLTELLPSIANPPPHLTIPIPSAQPITQDYNSKPPISWNHMIPENNSPYQAPAAYQHSHFQALSKPLSSSFFQLPLPPPPAPPAVGEHGISSIRAWNGLSSYTSMRAQPTESPFQSQTGQYLANSLVQEPDQMLHSTDNFGLSSMHMSNLMTRQGGPHRVVEDCSSGHAVQGVNPSLAQAQPNTLLFKGMHSSVTGGLPMGSTSDYRPYFQHASYGLQHSAAGLMPASNAELGTVSSTSRITPGFLETNRPSYMRDLLESRSSNYLNTYASSFNLPPRSQLSSNVLIQENYTAINTKYGAPVGMSTAPVDDPKIGIVGSDNKSVFPRPSGDQYDPLFDYIEPASNSFSKADHQKRETIGDSDEVLGISGSGRVLNMEGIKQEGGSAASANDSLENEECGETADIEVDGVLNATHSNPNDATDMNVGDIEIDQVKTSGKKKKCKERSMKHFKISIATFVKDVLKPSWRQGNMSKEAFKTIVKKTVDKVSGAMKSHQIPKSQAKINHYIDSSRGKLTKLVMGYVDKYVKV